jgi:hypothetical protein
MHSSRSGDLSAGRQAGEFTVVFFGGLSSLGEREIDVAVVDQNVPFV